MKKNQKCDIFFAEHNKRILGVAKLYHTHIHDMNLCITYIK